MNKFTAARNHCNCHPETCCCKDWAVFNPDGRKHSTHHEKVTAQQVADALNAPKPTERPVFAYYWEYDGIHFIDAKMTATVDQLREAGADLKPLYEGEVK